jgi:predicted DNA-binding protein (MmcQ/YjbR family)
LLSKALLKKTPFDKVTLVFKVMGKMFTLADIDRFVSINVKCNLEKAVELREQYEAVEAGYHMNKKHWNTIAINSDMPDKELYEWIRYSYDLVLASLPNKVCQSHVATQLWNKS